MSRQLSWTHLRSLIYIEDPLKRDFYLQMSLAERWSTRSLQERLDALLFERTALSRQPEELLATELAALRQTGALTLALILKAPYVLDFLGLHDRYMPFRQKGSKRKRSQSFPCSPCGESLL